MTYAHVETLIFPELNSTKYPKLPILHCCLDIVIILPWFPAALPLWAGQTIFVLWCLSPTFFFKKAKVSFLHLGCKKCRRAVSGVAVPRGCWARSVSVRSAPAPRAAHAYSDTQFTPVPTFHPFSGRVLHPELAVAAWQRPPQPWQQHCWARGVELSDIPELLGRTASSSLWQFSPHNITISQTHL